MASELRKSVVSGMAWSAIEKVGTMLLQVVVRFLLLRYFLTPEDIGVVGLLLVFITVSGVLADSGFSAALIRRRDVSQSDYTSVFFFNMVIALVFYMIFTGLSPLIADFYEIPILRSIAPVIFLIIPVNAVCLVQATILTRKMDFKSYTKFTLWANLIGSMVAVLMAFAGMGVWAIVGQRLAVPVVRALLLWGKSSWRPSGRLSMAPLRSMLGYSSRLLASDLANSIYANVSQLFIGKMSQSDLGHYEQARNFKDMPVSAIISTIQGVTFPAMSKLQDDPKKLANAGHQVIEVMNFLVFPVMIGLIAVAYDIFAVLLTDIWMPTVPYFKILCISGLFAPVSVISYNILKTKSDGKLIFRMELVKKLIATAILAVTIPLGVKAIVWGQVGIFFSDAVFNAIGASRYVRWKLWDRLREAAPYLLFSLIMWAGVYLTGLLLKDLITAGWLLLIKIAVGIIVYYVLARIFRPEGMREVRIIINRQK